LGLRRGMSRRTSRSSVIRSVSARRNTDTTPAEKRTSPDASWPRPPRAISPMIWPICPELPLPKESRPSVAVAKRNPPK
jgi:hypothetical protein